MSLNEWNKYKNLLSKISNTAVDEFRDAVWKTSGRFKGVGLGNIPRDELIEYAYGLATKYGEASSAVASEMYDAMALLQKAPVPAAIPAETATYSEVAKTVNGIIKNTGSEEVLAQGIGRLVKMAGTDTMLSNAYRDRKSGKGSQKRHTGAEVAWIPSGDTCPYCVMLASKGWQKQTEWGANNHSEHIHANCDCTYMVRFNNDFNVEGYDPEEYKEMYDSADGSTQEEKLNSMRREAYSENKEEINEQKRVAYHLRTGELSAEEYAIAKEYWNRLTEYPDLSGKEKEYIYELFDNNLSDEEKQMALVCRPFGNNRYYAVHKGHNQYKIYNVEPIEQTDNIVDEVLTEMFGSDWKRYLDE